MAPVCKIGKKLILVYSLRYGLFSVLISNVDMKENSHFLHLWRYFSQLNGYQYSSHTVGGGGGGRGGGGCCLICFIPSSCYTILHILVLITDYSVYLIKMYIVRLKAAVTVNRGHLLFLSNWSHLRLVCPGASVCPTLNFEFFVRFMRLISVHYFHLFIHICNIKNINYTSTHA